MRDFIKPILLSLPKWLREHLLPLLLTIRVGGLLIAAIALWAFYEIAEDILEQESFVFDQQILLTLYNIQTPILNQIMLGITFLGEPTFLFFVGAICVIWLLLQGKRSQATTVIIAGGGAGILNIWLKDLFGRSRPELWERIIDVQLKSFPSGHAMISMVVYSLLGYLLATTFPRWSKLIIIVTTILILGIGLSRLYLGVHWPTDVIAGYAAGTVWLIACVFSFELWRNRRINAEGNGQ
ncbi:MAG: phosphatase PAP2 family protein [Chroococcales cyanobacterium]